MSLQVPLKFHLFSFVICPVHRFHMLRSHPAQSPLQQPRALSGTQSFISSCNISHLLTMFVFPLFAHMIMEGKGKSSMQFWVQPDLLCQLTIPSLTSQWCSEHRILPCKFYISFSEYSSTLRPKSAFGTSLRVVITMK